MTLHYNDSLRNVLLNNMRGNINGTCTIYPGTRPPDPDFPTNEAALVAFQLSYGSAVDGRISLSNAPIAAVASATGTATWFRVVDGSYKFDGDVSIAGGGGDAILDNVNLVVSEVVALKKMDFSISNP